MVGQYPVGPASRPIAGYGPTFSSQRICEGPHPGRRQRQHVGFRAEGGERAGDSIGDQPADRDDAALGGALPPSGLVVEGQRAMTPSLQPSGH